MTLAVTALKRGQVKRIILTRPAVEAGESLGFLPGDLKEKVDPYLRPVYDALYQILGERPNYSDDGAGDYRDCAFGLYAGADLGRCLCHPR